MERQDLAIIGTGPAGLSAALTAKARNKSFLLFGSASLSPKVQKAHRIANYLGLPDISGEEMQRIFRAQLSSAGITVTEAKVTLIYPMGGYFSIQAGTEIYEAGAVILAGGMAPQKLLDGEEEFLGRGVSYCATCDAALYRGKSAIVIGYSPEEEAEARFLTEYADKVLYIPMYSREANPEPVAAADPKPVAAADPKPGAAADPGPVVEVRRVKPLAITGRMKADTLVTDEGELHADGIFVLRESVLPGQLVPGLAMDGNHVAVDRSMATNVPGCFAAGDITGTPYQYMKAAGEGNVAALSAVKYLDEQRRKAAGT